MCNSSLFCSKNINLSILVDIFLFDLIENICYNRSMKGEEEDMNIHQYEVHLMNAKDMITHIVNCANEESAKNICEGIFPNYRVIEIIVKI